jgi:hypothetical protein
MESEQNGGAPAPVENVSVPAAAPEGAASEPVKPVAETPAAKPEGEEPKGVAKRIKELTDRIRAAEQRESRYLSLLEQNRQQPAPQARESDEEPVKGLKDFNYDERAFLDYSEKRAIAKADKAAKAVAERYRVEQEAMSRRAKFDERVSAFAETVEDYHEVVTDSTPVSEGMADAIMESDEAGALMYYLGNNPDVARKLYQLSPAKAGREIQKLEDRLVAERKKAAEKPVSKAPPPAPQIDGAGDGSAKAKPDDPASDTELSDAEWTRRRNAQLRQRAR